MKRRLRSVVQVAAVLIPVVGFASDSREYIVRTSETLSRIAQSLYPGRRIYSNKGSLRLLIESNPKLRPPFAIHAGLKLKVPADARAAFVFGERVPASFEQIEDAPCTYVVLPGDTLSTIVQKLFPDRLIYPRQGGALEEFLSRNPTLNRSQKIFPGQELVACNSTPKIPLRTIATQPVELPTEPEQALTPEPLQHVSAIPPASPEPVPPLLAAPLPLTAPSPLSFATPSPSPSVPLKIADPLQQTEEPFWLSLGTSLSNSSFEQQINVQGNNTALQSSGFVFQAFSGNIHVPLLPNVSSDMAVSYSRRDITLQGSSHAMVDARVNGSLQYGIYHDNATTLETGLGFNSSSLSYFSLAAATATTINIGSATLFTAGAVVRATHQNSQKSLTAISFYLGTPIGLAGSNGDALSSGGGYELTAELSYKRFIKPNLFINLGPSFSIRNMTYTQTAPFQAIGTFHLLEEAFRTGLGFTF